MNDYVQVGAQSSLVMTSAASFSAWIHPTGPGSQPLYGGIIVNKEGEYEIARFPDGTIQWAFANTNPGWNWINTGSVAPLNQWTHVAVVYESGVVKTYINGVLTHTHNGSGAIGDVDNTQNDFRVGGRQVSSHHFQGRIDEVRVYNRALTANEVSALPVVVSSEGSELNWLVADQLGTPRMIFDKTGLLATTKRHDYLPFGEELFAGVGGRTPTLGYTGDTLRQRFTQKERDIETGLDYFLARYYSSTQGRFTSPDEFSGGPDELYFFVDDASANPTFYADLKDPQSLNKYQYAYNNPLRYVDPDGHEPDPDCCDQETEKRVATGAATGAAVGAVVGGVVGAGSGARAGGAIGLAGGPPGVVVGVVAGGGAGAASGAVQGAAVGAVIGGLVGYVYDKVVGPSNPPIVPPVPISETPPQSPAQPLPPPPPVEARHRKGRRKSTHNKHTKVRPGDKKPPNYTPFRRPPPKPKPAPPPPKPKPTPKPEIGPDGLPVKPPT